MEADGELVDVSTMSRALVVFAVFRAHDELARGDSRNLQQGVVSHFLWVECT